MSPIDFEYAIKKDVRNNLIVREVDDERQRQVWRSLAIGGFLVIVILFSAWQHFELLQHGYNIQKMQKERADQEEINRQLHLQIATLRAPARIAGLAKSLHLVPPARGEAIVIQRVTPSAPPEKSIVAAR
ncbi:MAG: cell division protein FtsL [Acidobacteriota bacterium]|jgi:cell division protein FtsL